MQSRKPHSRTTKDRIRASMLARYARIREAVAVYNDFKKHGVVVDTSAKEQS